MKITSPIPSEPFNQHVAPALAFRLSAKSTLQLRFLTIFLATTFLCYGTILAQHSSPGYYVPATTDFQQVSIVQLIANPQLYDGKRIQIIGYLRLEYEGNALYLHREDFDQQISENAIWIDYPKDLTTEQKNAVNNKYVICEGIFHGNIHGHMDQFSGEISDMNRLQPWIVSKPKHHQ
jgi:hypothetical protein